MSYKKIKLSAIRKLIGRSVGKVKTYFAKFSRKVYPIEIDLYGEVNEKTLEYKTNPKPTQEMALKKEIKIKENIHLQVGTVEKIFSTGLGDNRPLSMARFNTSAPAITFTPGFDILATIIPDLIQTRALQHVWTSSIIKGHTLDKYFYVRRGYILKWFQTYIRDTFSTALSHKALVTSQRFLFDISFTIALCNKETTQQEGAFSKSVATFKSKYAIQCLAKKSPQLIWELGNNMMLKFLLINGPIKCNLIFGNDTFKLCSTEII